MLGMWFIEGGSQEVQEKFPLTRGAKEWKPSS